ncbi:MAG: FG-GAP-like repeat-containing protein, partial [Bryobacteraceae bacterium]
MTWDRRPSLSDPRIPFAAILLTYVILGVTVLGFNRTPAQIALTILAACVLDMGLYALFHRRLLFPLSAVISGLSLAILMNYAHGLWLPLLPVMLAIGSKYAITVKGRHVFNPTLFAVVASIWLGQGMFSAAPAYQWGGGIAVAIFVVTAALSLFVFRIHRNALILSFLGLYFAQLALRSYLTRYHVPPETLFLGALTSASFYLFTFFMITDPQTSPPSAKGQVAMSAAIVTIDLILHRFGTLSTLFNAAFLYFVGRFAWLHWQEYRERQSPWMPRLQFGLRRVAVIGGILLLGCFGYQRGIRAHASAPPAFHLTEIPAAESGLDAAKGDVLERVDQRVANVAKWVLSVGDAVAVADVDLNGKQDVFLTYPLKDAQHRASLYLYKGGNRFERFPWPELSAQFAQPETNGLPAGAIWFDYDNDGDPDLLLQVGYGPTRLYQNRVIEDGLLSFRDVTREVGLGAYTISVGANALDFDRDGKLDLMLCSAFSPALADYNPPERFN